MRDRELPEDLAQHSVPAEPLADDREPPSRSQVDEDWGASMDQGLERAARSSSAQVR